MIENQESITAKLCAFARAFYSTRDKSAADSDYLAFDLLGAQEYISIADMIRTGHCPAICQNCKKCDVRHTVSEYLAPIPVSREVFAADKFHGFLERRSYSQYVICGAGMDTFSFRNHNSNVEVFEIDHPDTQRYKIERVKKLGWKIESNMHFVSVDFSCEDMVDNLLKSGFDPDKPSFFVILGLTYYLSVDQLRSLIEKIGRLSKAPAAIVLDYPEKLKGYSADRVVRLAQMTDELGETMTQGFELKELTDILESHDFGFYEHLDPAAIQNRYLDKQAGLKAFENIHFLYAENSYDRISNQI